MAKRKQEYGNESISMLEGADRVRKRPGVIFGSDGLEGCEHAVFEILSNAIDEAREGFGKEIVVTHFRDGRIQVEDFGRGCPVDWNEKVGKYNWELVFCELYAGGKYDNNGGDNYEYSLGLNGLGACATQYTARFMDVIVRRDGKRYDLWVKTESGWEKQDSTVDGSYLLFTSDRETVTFCVQERTASPLLWVLLAVLILLALMLVVIRIRKKRGRQTIRSRLRKARQKKS